MAGTGKKASETLRALEHNIASGEWPVNSRIPREAELMDLFGVGKSTVREAVRSLAAVGMLEPIKGVGTFVRSRTPVSSVVSQFVGAYPPSEVLEYRRLLEVEAARTAALCRTEAQLTDLRRSHESDVQSDDSTFVRRGETPGSFHQLIFEASGNTLLRGMYSALMAAVRVQGAEGLLDRSTDDEARRRDHARILRAIEAQDPVAAAAAMAVHTECDLTVRPVNRG